MTTAHTTVYMPGSVGFLDRDPHVLAEIHHLLVLNDEYQSKYPWREGQWELKTEHAAVGFYDTLKDAMDAAAKLWPDCRFIRAVKGPI